MAGLPYRSYRPALAHSSPSISPPLSLDISFALARPRLSSPWIAVDTNPLHKTLPSPRTQAARPRASCCLCPSNIRVPSPSHRPSPFEDVKLATPVLTVSAPSLPFPPSSDRIRTGCRRRERSGLGLSSILLCNPCGIPSAYELTRTRLRTASSSPPSAPLLPLSAVAIYIVTTAVHVSPLPSAPSLPPSTCDRRRLRLPLSASPLLSAPRRRRLHCRYHCLCPRRRRLHRRHPVHVSPLPPPCPSLPPLFPLSVAICVVAALSASSSLLSVSSSSPSTPSSLPSVSLPAPSLPSSVLSTCHRRLHFRLRPRYRRLHCRHLHPAAWIVLTAAICTLTLSALSLPLPLTAAAAMRHPCCNRLHPCPLCVAAASAPRCRRSSPPPRPCAILVATVCTLALFVSLLPLPLAAAAVCVVLVLVICALATTVCVCHSVCTLAFSVSLLPLPLTATATSAVRIASARPQRQRHVRADIRGASGARR
ncbi:hypothetical protein EDB85DRAFT_2197846 [Lactarius pseudohatsudake]|nr:hypothetical protein EDB85DRAFT_2197846 [Lactarius pseudohatsudake]